MKHDHLSIVLINYQSAELINANLARIHGLGARECIVVDNSGEFEPSADNCKVLRPGKNLGFGTAANLAAQTLRSDWMVLINPDLEISTEELARFLAPTLAEHAPAMILPKHTPGAPCVGFSGDIRYIAKRIPASNPDWVFCQGFCLVALNLQAFRKIGGFDEKIFMYGEDLDLTIRILKNHGATAIQTSQAEFVHAGGASYTGPLRKLRRLKHSFASSYYVLGKHAASARMLRKLFFALLFSYPKLVRIFPNTALLLA